MDTLKQELFELNCEIECREDKQDAGEGPPVRRELYVRRRELQAALGLEVY